jgi:hypothetical protein
MSWDREDRQNQDNVLDALEDWPSGLFDEQDAAIQRTLDAERRQSRWRRWGLGLVVGGLLVAGGVFLSGCGEVACFATRVGGYTGPHPTCQAARPEPAPATAALKGTP